MAGFLSSGHNYHLGQLNRPVYQIDIQRNMAGFVVDGHIMVRWSLVTLHPMSVIPYI